MCLLDEFDRVTVLKCDLWLGTRRKGIWSHLSPIKFGLDADVQEETAIRLFARVVKEDIGILGTRYMVECPHCQQLQDWDTINRATQCLTCQQDYKINADNVLIYFRLLKEPAKKEVVFCAESCHPSL